MAREDAIITLAIVGNVLNLAYNVPLVWRVVKLWDARNLSWYFLAMRIIGSIVWICYAALAVDTWIGISYSVTLLSSSLLTVVKVFPCSDHVVEEENVVPMRRIAVV